MKNDGKEKVITKIRNEAIKYSSSQEVQEHFKKFSFTEEVIESFINLHVDMCIKLEKEMLGINNHRQPIGMSNQLTSPHLKKRS